MTAFSYPVTSGITYADDAGASVSVEPEPADERVVLISQDRDGNRVAVALTPIAARFLSMQLGELADVIEGDVIEGEQPSVSGLCSGCGASQAECLACGFEHRCCAACNHLGHPVEGGGR